MKNNIISLFANCIYMTACCRLLASSERVGDLIWGFRARLIYESSYLPVLGHGASACTSFQGDHSHLRYSHHRESCTPAACQSLVKTSSDVKKGGAGGGRGDHSLS